MVRRSQTSNPRSVVVLTSGADWGTRAAGQRRSSGADAPIPRRQPAKIKALRQTIGVARIAINNKRWHEARYALSRARALINALPADLTVQEREQLSQLRRKYAARNTPAAQKARNARNAKKAKSSVSPSRAGGKKPAAKKSTAKSTPRKSEPTPARSLNNRYFDRTLFGYAPIDKA